MMTRLSVKTLRHYHEIGLLVPDYIDEDNGYRYYNERSAEKAQVIVLMRDMGFPLKELKEILEKYDDDAHILEYLEKRREDIQARLDRIQEIQASLDLVIEGARRNEMNKADLSFEVKEKELEEIRYAGHRLKGEYHEIGAAFKKVARKAGMSIVGSAIGLFYDGEYKEKDADFEGGFGVKKEIEGEGINCRILPGGRAVTVLYQGPYTEIGSGYEKAFQYLEEKGYEMSLPTREVYLKGPGMIFKGNPKKYLTEIQIPLK